MGTFKQLVNGARKRWHFYTHRRQIERNALPHRSKFCLEFLEPRLLLSSDVLRIDPPQEQTDLTASAIVEEYSPTDQIRINWEGADNRAMDDSTTETPARGLAGGRNLTPETLNLLIDSSIRRIASGEWGVASDEWNQPETRKPKPKTGDASSITDQLIETLRVANAPPILPEMRLVNDDLSLLYGQLIFLDFDGASGLTYNGLVRVERVEVYAFQAAADLAGQEAAIINYILTSLSERFADLRVTFTSTQPEADSQYSTIYIGGDGSAFSQYGSFLGLAEKVDIGNQDKNDIAFVFSDRLALSATRYAQSVEEYMSALTEVIAHEAMHLLGYEHAQEDLEGLFRVAAADDATSSGTQEIITFSSSRPAAQFFELSPLRFEPNRGQTDPEVVFLARGLNYGLFLTNEGAVLKLTSTGSPGAESSLSSTYDPGRPRATAVVSMELVGANPTPVVNGLGPLGGVSNYLLGSDPSSWHTRIPSYAEVQYQDVYPGIDLLYHGTAGELEYDWVVDPGANPGQINLGFRGADNVSLDDQGNLLLQTGAGIMVQRAPVLYQETNGVRHAVAGGYRVTGDGTLNFEVGEYDPSRPLVIDPVLVYSTYLGGSAGQVGLGQDITEGVAVDSEGNTYVTGTTSSFDFPTTGGSFQSEPPDQVGLFESHDEFGNLVTFLAPVLNDLAFVTKLDPTGQLVYSTYIGESIFGPRIINFAARGIAVDTDGNAYIAGDYYNNRALNAPIEEPDGPGAIVFAAKLDPTGSSLLYLSQWGGGQATLTDTGGPPFDVATAIAIDTAGNAYVTGFTNKNDFPTLGVGAMGEPFQQSFGGGFDAFVTKLDPAGVIDYSTYLGGIGWDFGNDIAVDDAGNAFVTGTWGSGGLPVTVTPFPEGGLGGFNVFIAQLDPFGSTLPFSTLLGGSGFDGGGAIALDANGQIYVVGETNSENFPTVDAVQGTLAFFLDTFVARIDPKAHEIVFSTFLGGSGDDSAIDLALDSVGNIYITGMTFSQDFPTANPIQASKSADVNLDTGTLCLEDLSSVECELSSDAFVTKMSGDGKALVYSTYLGGSGGRALLPGGLHLFHKGNDVGLGIAVDAAGNASIVGVTSSLSFPIRSPLEGQESFQGSAALFEETDGFVAKIAERGTVQGLGGTATQRLPYSGTVATFRSPRPNAAEEDFIATIDWGDGSTDSTQSGVKVKRVGSGADIRFAVIGTHTYNQRGAYPVLVQVFDQETVNLDPATNINVSGSGLNESGGTVAIDPTNPSRIFMASNIDIPGLFSAFSADGGLTWSPRIIANGSDDLPKARVSVEPLFDQADPQAAFDEFGNLFLTYLGADGNNVVVALSADGGKSFLPLINQILPGTTPGSVALVDQPSIATGPAGSVGGSAFDGSVWITYADKQNDHIVVSAARVTGLQFVESFSEPQMIPNSVTGNFGDIEIGPLGQVLVLWQDNGSDDQAGPPGSAAAKVFVSLDPDGLGSDQTFFDRTFVVASNTGRGAIPAMPNRAVNVEANLAWDRSGGENHGRVYVAYSEPNVAGDPTDFTDIDILVKYSDDDGVTWSPPFRVNDDTGSASQFLPAIAVDQKTGNVAVTWYDARNDSGSGGFYDTDGISNTDVMYFAAVSQDGAFFSPNLQISTVGATNSDAAKNSSGIGDYTSVAFFGGMLLPVWADNSPGVSEGFAEGGKIGALDLATVVIGVVNVPFARVAIRPVAFQAVEDAVFSGTVATFTHPDPARQPGEFEAMIDWGDETTAGLVTRPGPPGTPFVVTGSHTYHQEGGYPVVVKVHDTHTGLDAVAVSDISRRQVSQAEATIAIDPTNPDRVFAAANDFVPPSGDGVLVAFSTDGGVTWNSRILGDGSDGLPLLLGDPKAVFDEFGNLYFTLLKSDRAVVVLLSTDGGQTFKELATFSDQFQADQPSIATGPRSGGGGGSVWVTYEFGPADESGNVIGTERIVVAGAEIIGLGNIGPFSKTVVAPTSDDGTSRNFGDIAVGPEGQVMVIYQAPVVGGDVVLFHLDPDGLGPVVFGPPMKITDTNVSGFYRISAQKERTIDAEANLAWDRSDSEHRGRVYLSYTNAPAEGEGDPDNTDIFLRYSDNNGSTWSEPLLVNKDEPAGSQFLPSIAVDQSSGNLAIAWHTAAGLSKKERTEFVAVVSDDGGQTFRPSLRLSPGFSDATDPASDQAGLKFQFGDYTSVSFVDGILQPVWSDNSGELEGNPDPPRFEIANARIGIAQVAGVPLAAAAIDLSVFEDRLFTKRVATFTDPDPDGGTLADYSARIDWGDGTTPVTGVIEPDGTIGFAVTGTHKFTEKGAYEFTVTIKGRASVAAVNGTADVVTELTATGHDVAAFVGRGFTATVATFTDADPDSAVGNFTAAIDWGDGLPPSVSGIAPIANGVYGVAGAHTYSQSGSFPIAVLIQHAAGPSATASSTASVLEPALVVAEEAILAAFEDITTSVVMLATFEVNGPVGAPADYAATIDWGDLSPPESGSIDIQGALIDVSGTHTYTAGGTYHPLVRLANNGGFSETAISTIDVATNVSSQVLAVGSGLVYNPLTQLFQGSVTVTNTSATDIKGPIFEIVLTGLPSGITLVNPTGFTGGGDPFLSKNLFELAVGQSVLFPVGFSNPLAVPFQYMVKTFRDPPSRFGSSSADPDASETAQRSVRLFDATPLSFEPNEGQTDKLVAFMSRAPGYALFLTPEGTTLRLGGDESASPAVVRMQWVGSNPAPTLRGLDPLPSVSNYLIGNDPASWRIGVPNYAKVLYDEVYPGIDLVFHGTAGELEYDWIVAAGADPGQIAMEVSGADGLTLDAQGRLLLQAGAGEVLLHAPILYQEHDGHRHTIAGGYMLGGGGLVSFDVGDYDPSLPLVIDPVLVYSTYLGGSDIEENMRIAVDSAGNAYVAGATLSVDFPTEQALDPSFGDGDAFVSKRDLNGMLIFSTYLGGSFGDTGRDIAVDRSGNIYITGTTKSGDFPTTPVTSPIHILPETTGFITKLDSTGSTLLFSKLLGTAAAPFPTAIAVDGGGAVYIAGVHKISNVNTAAIVSKLLLDTQEVDYRVVLDAEDFDAPFDIAVDSSGNAYVVGLTASTNFLVANAIQPTHGGGQFDAFITKLDADGSVTYSSYLGGSGDDSATGIAVDPLGNAYITGVTGSTDFPTQNAFQRENQGSNDAFLTKLDSSGQNFIYSTYVGGSGVDEARDIAIDTDGKVLIVGSTSSTNFPIANALQSVHRGGVSHPSIAQLLGFTDPFKEETDAFVTAFNAAGSALFYSTYLGGTGTDSAFDVALDASGNAYVVGGTSSRDLRTINASQDFFGGGFVDGFIAKIAPAGSGTLTVFNKPILAIEGALFSGLVASFTDTDSDLPGDYVATIDWGDGEGSVGMVTGDGNGSFNIFGAHTYGDQGFYPVTIAVHDHDGSTVTATSTAASTDTTDFVNYHLVIDTSALSGTMGFLSFQYNPGATPGSQSSEMILTNFATGGGVMQDGASVHGAVSGDHTSEIRISNSFTLNRLTQALVFGVGLSFDLRISGDAIADPDFGFFGSRFALQLLAADGLTPLLTTDRTGAVLTLDVEPDGSTKVAVFLPASGGPVASAAANNIAIVLNAPLAALEVPIHAVEGVIFAQIVATFTNANPFETASDTTAMIDWGDGRPASAGTIAPNVIGGFSVTGSHTYMEVGNFPLRITITDEDGGTAVTVPRISGTGGIQASRVTSIGGLSPETLAVPDLAVANFNGDTLPDLYFSSSTAVAVLLGNSDGTFEVAQFPAGVAAVGDFNGDGKTDLAIANAISGNVSVLLGNGDGTFQTPINRPTNSTPGSVMTADFNGDGKLDLATGNGTAGNISILLGNGDGTLQAPINSATNTNAGSITAADFNGDDKPDVVVVNPCAPFCANFVTVLVGNGDGTFQAPVPYTTGTGPHTIAVSDLDTDGNLDLVVNNGLSRSVSILQGKGDGRFGPASDLSGLGTPGVARIGDFNRDGKPDLAVPSMDTIKVLIGNGDGSFAPAVSYAVIGFNRIALGDFNGDGRADILASDAGSQDVVGGLSVLLGKGDGSFLPAVRYGAIARIPVLADFNADGNLDVAGTDLGGVVVVLGKGDGTLVSPNVFPTGDFPRSIGAGDFNGDRKLDLVTTHDLHDFDVLGNLIGRGGFSVHMGNGDGTLQPAVHYFTGTRPDSLAVGDVNRDGKADLVTGDKGGVSPGVSVSLGIGDGTFKPTQRYALPLRVGFLERGSPTDIALGDLNRDGKTDLVVDAGTSDSVLLGNGDGTFQAPRFLSEPFAALGTVSPGDFNADGRLDIAGTGGFFSALGDFSSVNVFLGNGDGTFQPAVNYRTATNPVSTAVADLNGDGKPDLVTANEGFDATTTTAGSISVLLGVGDGTFQAAVNYRAPASPSEFNQLASINVADFNGDGHPDLAVAGGVPGSVPRGFSVLFNNGDGTFGPFQTYSNVAGSTRSLMAADFNRDGRPDLATANRDDDTVSIILNTVTVAGATVANAPLTATGNDLNPIAGRLFTAVVASFADANVFGAAADFTASINWGDGQITSGVITANDRGGFDVSGSHTYALAAVRTIGIAISDDDGGTVTATGIARVNNADFALTAAGVMIDATEGVALTAVVATFTDADPFGTVGDFSAVIDWGDGQRSGGGITAAAAGFIVIGTHTYAEEGTFAVRVDIVDIGGSTATAMSTALVIPNEPPLALDDEAITDEDTPVRIDVLANDSDVDGNRLTAVLVVGPAHGMLTLNLDGSLTYAPLADFFGADSFTYKANDGVTDSNPVKVTLTVNAVNDAPIARAHRPSTAEDVVMRFAASNLLANDSPGPANESGQTLKLIGVATTAATHGTVSLIAGTITYTPDPNYNGPASFEYTIEDNGSTNGVADPKRATGAVNVTVAEVNDPPTANPDSRSVAEDTTLMFAASTLLANDAPGPGNESGQTLRVIRVAGTAATHGTVSLVAGTISYTPDPDYNGPASFSYTIEDNGTTNGMADPEQATGTVTVTVSAVADAPVVTGLNVSATEGSPFAALVATFTDADPDQAVGDFIATVAWGDGSTSAGTIVSNGRGGFDVTGSHTYTRFGSYPLRVTIQEVDGSTITVPMVALQTAASYPTGASPRSVAVEDFNADGRLDLATATADGVSVLLGNGDGTFQAAVNYAAGFNAASVVVGDFNGDGSLDLATGSFALLGNGDGTFQSPLNYAAGGSVTVGDFNADGRLDLAGANASTNNVSVLVGNGDGTFQSPVNYAAGVRPMSVAVGDFNADSRLDLATANQSGSNVSVLLGKGDGTFEVAVNYAAGDGPVLVAVGDFSGDGVADLAVANQFSNDVSVLLGNGDGTFQGAVNYAAGFEPLSVVVGDFTGDTRLDLAVANFFGNDVSVLVGNGDGSFQRPLNYVAGESPFSVAVGDLNGDDTLDLAVVNTGLFDFATATFVRSGVSVLIGEGDGRFRTPVNYLPGADLFSVDPAAVAVGDFTGDGTLDLAVANEFGSFNGSGAVGLLVGKGDGRFQAATEHIAGEFPNSVAVGDLNRDGKLDLAVANLGGVSVLLGNGDGTFQGPVNFAAGAGPQSVAVGDFNSDGKPDLAVANSSSNNVSVLLGNGDGSFRAAVSYAAGFRPLSVAVGDFNSDGKPDLAVANSSSNNVSVLLGNGDGTFRPAANYRTGDEPRSVVVGDFSGDGLLDLAVANEFSNDVSVLLGNGDGTFQGAVNYVAGESPVSAAVGDFSGDGLLDLAVANEFSNDVSVLIGNGDGTFEPAVNYVVGQGPGPVAMGDFNRDRVADLAVANRFSLHVSVLLTAAATPIKATVADAALAAAGTTIRPPKGEPFTGVIASFTDANPFGTVADFTATIHWGDGQTSAGTITANDSGGFDVSGTNTYAEEGSFAVIVQITGDGPSRATAHSMALVGAINTAPVARDDQAATNEDTPVMIDVLANDSDSEGDTLAAALVSTPAQGALALNPDGSFTYTPAANFHGSDAFTYKANDGSADSNLATVTITVNPVNDGPIANDDAYTVDEDGALTIAAAQGVLTNDTDVDGDALTALLVSGPDNGMLTLKADGSFTYTPTANFNGEDSFTYRANDGALASNVATVGITVSRVNDLPVAKDDVGTASEGTPVTLDVLGNDTDVDRDALTVVNVTQGASGAVVANDDGTVSYTPNANFTGVDTFTYTASDGQGGADTATVSVTVVELVTTANADLLNFLRLLGFELNNTPVAQDDIATTDEDAPVVIDVLANDSDVDGDVLTPVLVAGPANGILTLNADGSFTYTPDVDFNGSDSFTYRANDGQLDSNTATVSLTVNALNDAPVGMGDTVTTLEDTPYTFSAADFGFIDPNDSPANTLLAVKIATLPAAGTLTNDGINVIGGQFIGVADLNAGKLLFTPPANANGAAYASFTFQVQDNGGTENGGIDLDQTAQLLTINVTPVNDAPVVDDQTFTVDENSANETVVGIIAATDVDAETILTFAVTGGTGQVAFAVDPATGQITVAESSLLNFETTPSFTLQVTVTDNGIPQLSDTALIMINLTDVNEAPVIISNGGDEVAGASVDENTTAVTTVTAEDPDAGTTLSFSIVGGADQNKFTIDALTGTLAFLVAPDFEAPADAGNDNIYEVIVQVSDSGNLFDEQAIAVAVLPVNDNNPLFTSTATPSVAENDTAVVTLTATDADLPAQTVSFSISGGTDQDKFQIVSGNQLQFVRAPDFENPSDADGDNVYLVTVRATDNSNLFTDQSLSVNVTNLNEQPTDIALSKNTVAENQPSGTQVGSLSATDPDMGDMHSFSLVGGSGSTDNALFQIVGNELRTSASFDFETKNSFTIRVRATDSGGLFFEKVFAIYVTDVNEAPVAVGDAYSVNEDEVLVVSVPGVLVNDSDVDGDALTAVLVMGPMHGTLSLSADGSFTYTPTANFNDSDSFSYKANDGKEESNIATVMIVINPVNDAPVLTAVSVTPVINENDSVTLAGTFTDPDPEDTHTVVIDWGDGTIETVVLGAGVRGFNLTHQYLDDDPTATAWDTSSIHVNLSDHHGASASASLSTIVNNVAPTAELFGLASGVRGQTLHFLGSYVDPGTLDTHQVAWDFGDGTVRGYQAVSPEAMAPSHVYRTSGTYIVTLKVRDDDGGVDTVRYSVTIKAVELQVDPCEPGKTALVVGGTNGNDKIRFVPQGNKGEIKVLINGESQGIFKPTGSIIAYGLGGDDDIEVAGSISLKAFLFGDDGNDRLKGGAGPSVLCGGAGDDFLIGGSGKSILIGDGGADRLVGNSQDDILIGGTSQYGCDLEALCAIFDEWTRTDRSYAQRINNLTNGGGLNGNIKLNKYTVFDDGAFDMLTGAAGLDWFFTGANDKITDRHPFETVTPTNGIAELAISGLTKRRSIFGLAL